MAELGYNELKEQFAPITNELVVKGVDGLEEAVSNLSDGELSMNLLPLGKRLAQEGDAKYVTLLSEAGKRLAFTDGSKELNGIARATILHALDRFVSEDCKIPEGCTHFEEFGEVPSTDRVLELIDMFENYGGITLTALGADEAAELESVFGEDTQTEEAPSGRAVGTLRNRKTGEEIPITPDAQGAKTLIEKLTGQKLSQDVIDQATAQFAGVLVNEHGETPEKAIAVAGRIRAELSELVGV